MTGPQVSNETKNNMAMHRNPCSTLQIANELRREGKGEEGGGGRAVESEGRRRTARAGGWWRKSAKDESGELGVKASGIIGVMVPAMDCQVMLV